MKTRGLETTWLRPAGRRGNLDDVDAEEGGVGVLVGGLAGAACELGGLADEGGAGDVDVDVVLIVGVDDEGVGVGAAAGLDGGYLLGILDVGDVEDADAAEAVGAGGGEGLALFFVAGGGFRWVGREALGAAVERPLGISTDMKRRWP